MVRRCDKSFRCVWWLSALVLTLVHGNNLSQQVQERPPCQPGFYCPLGSFTPLPCPKGTYGPAADAVSIESCLKCPPQHYSPRPGLSASLPCGPVAQQPLSGQDTCICLGEGQTFQTNDGLCHCTIGYQPANNGDVCAQKQYDVCSDGKTRSQYGNCMDRYQWSLHCMQQVCQSAEDYRGYDGELGLCVCKEPPGRAPCGGLCRRRPATELELLCRTNGEMELVWSYGHQVMGVSGKLQETFLKRSDSDGTLCNSHISSSHAVYIVQTTEAGFLGLLSGLPKELQRLFTVTTERNAELNTKSSAERDFDILWEVTKVENISHEGRENNGNKSDVKEEIRELSVTGVLNPTTCLQLGDVILFTVDTHHYPQYDLDNLYNTNRDFDWGAVRRLKEELTLSWTPPNFFALVFSQAGVYVFTLSSQHHKHMYVRVMPAGGQCYETGPFFPTIPRHVTRLGISRRRNLLLRPDWLVTGGLLFGAVVILCLCVTLLILFREYGWPEKKPIKAWYRLLQLSYNMDDYSSKGSRVISLRKIHRNRQARMTQDSIQPGSLEEFWDYEHQVDLEAFSSNTFYSLLLKQSLSVTTRLGQLTSEVKELYQGVLGKLQLRTLLHSQLQVLGREQQAQQRVYSVLTAQLREGTRILSKVYSNNHQLNLFQRLTSLVEEMGELVSAECQRQGAWGFLGEGTGAKLLCPDTGTVLTKDHVFGPDGSLRVCRAVRYSRVMPIAGNVAYDPASSTLVFTTDSCSEDNRKWDSPLLPFIPYPTSCHSDRPLPSARLRGLRPGQRLQLGCPMADPDTGVPVPILAVTIHPQTGLVYPLGGLHVCPLTRLPQPIQMGCPMLDSRTGDVVLTVGVSLDPVTGAVLPVGGILLAEPFIEPLSGRMVRVGGANIRAGQLLPNGGGYQALLDSKVLAVIFKVLEILKPLTEEWGSDQTLQRVQSSERGSGPHEHLLAAASELQQAWGRSLYSQLQLQTRLCFMLDWTAGLQQDGGSLGEMPLFGSDMSVPALLGMEYPDPMGSGLSVPVLGCQTDLVSGNITALAGTMEDPDGKGLVAIRYGSQTVDPVTGVLAPVVGVRLDVSRKNVVPVTASYWLTVADQTDSVQVEALQREVCVRNTYWQQQRQREEDIFSDLDSALFHCLFRAIEEDSYQVQWSGRQLNEAAVELQESAQNEAQRRVAQHTQLALILPPHVLDILTLGDEQEWDRQCLQQDKEKWTTHGGDWNTPVHVMDRELRQTELWEQCCSRQTELEVALNALHFVRHLSQLRADTAQAVLCGNFCYKEYGLVQCSGRTPTVEVRGLLQQMALPLLEKLNQLLEDKQPACFSPNTCNQHISGFPTKMAYGLDLASRVWTASVPVVKESQPMKESSQPSRSITVPTIPEEEWTKLLELSPLFQLLKGMDLQLKGWACGAGLLRGELSDRGKSFVDVLDAQWECEGELIPLDLSALNPREYLVYQHGLFLIDTLNNLKLEAEQTLFIRRQRLQSVGGFSLLLLHCLSHIKIKDMSSDSSPAFQRLFFKEVEDLQRKHREASLLSHLDGLLRDKSSEV
ncbi:ABC transporter G family member 28 [Dissostichus eleginoides]|uniref:ABC transporter G family member 28 n=1 Tax=Dissostichus eleginoides TaxID=100907 RepID=A0AAD9CGJ3_DISEL|nr:ABC transporter G family member 28 [Dissostichus eleginoides]